MCDSNLMKCYPSGQVKGLFNATRGECSIIFTICVSCLSSGTNRPLEDFRLSQFTWGCYENNRFLLTSEISTRSRCGLQSIQKCPAQRSHQTDVSRWVPASQMLHGCMPFRSTWTFSQLHKSIRTALCPLNTPTSHLYVDASDWSFLNLPLGVWSLFSAILSGLSLSMFQFLNRSCTWSFYIFLYCQTNVDSSEYAAVISICHTGGKSMRGNTDQMHEKCIFDFAVAVGGGGGGGGWESSLGGGGGGGMSGGSTFLLTGFWVSAPWRAALDSLLSSSL